MNLNTIKRNFNDASKLLFKCENNLESSEIREKYFPHYVHDQN